MIGIGAELGGFFDIGDKHMLVAVDDLSLVATDDKSCTHVTRFSEEAWRWKESTKGSGTDPFPRF